MRILALLLCFSVAGCAAQIIASTPRSVIIDAMGLADATPLAQAECQKFGRHARFSGKADAEYLNGYAFDCVE